MNFKHCSVPAVTDEMDLAFLDLACHIKNPTKNRTESYLDSSVIKSCTSLGISNLFYLIRICFQ